MVAMAYSSPVVIDQTVLYQGRASLVILPPAAVAAPVFVGMPDDGISITDSVLHPSMAAIVGAPSAPPASIPVASSSPVIIDSTVLYPGRAALVVLQTAAVVPPVFVAATDDGISIINNVIYPSMAALGIPPIAMPIVATAPMPVASSSPVVIDSTILYPAAARFVFTPPTVAAVPPVGWEQSFPDVRLPKPVNEQAAPFIPPQPTPPVAGRLAIGASSIVIIDQLVLYQAIVNPIFFPQAAATAPPIGWEQEWRLPSALRLPRLDDQPTSFLSGATLPPPPNVSNWYIQWPIPAARGAINVAALLSGVVPSLVFTTIVLPPNVANWYLQFPIPAARGAVNVAALIEGFTWSEVNTGGIKPGQFFDWLIRARRRGKR